MDGNKRSLSLIVVAFAVGALYFVVAQLWDGNSGGESGLEGVETPSDVEATQAEGTQGEATQGDGGEAEAPAELSPEERAARLETATIRTDLYEATIDNLAGGVTAFRIHGDDRFRTEEDEPLDVITTQQERWRSLRMQLGSIGIPDDAIWELAQVSEREVRLTWQSDRFRVVRSLSAGQGPYQIWSTVRVENVADYPQITRLELATYHYVPREDEEGFIPLLPTRSAAISQGVCVYGDDETERKDRSKLVDEDTHLAVEHGYGQGDVHVAAVENVYFAQALAAHGTLGARCAISGLDLGQPDPVGTLFEARLLYPWTELAPGAEQTFTTLAYLGPKDRDALNLAGHELPELLDLGFFAVIADQLAQLLHLLHGVIPNWGLAIIVLTLLIRLALFPLTNLSFSSMAKMRQLKPEMDRINELYKDDAEKKGAAVMELYRKHKVNPLAGCLPSLVQLPVWWALYTSLSTNIELYHMPFALWMSDLSSPDPYFVLPIGLGLLMHLQQRLTPMNMDPAQAKMLMYFMPLMITSFMLFLPSGLCLYMLTNSALGIAQMQLNNYRLSKQPPLGGDDDGDDEDEDSTEGAPDDDSSKTQKRRPRRKRRVRRGRA